MFDKILFSQHAASTALSIEHSAVAIENRGLFTGFRVLFIDMG